MQVGVYARQIYMLQQRHCCLVIESNSGADQRVGSFASVIWFEIGPPPGRFLGAFVAALCIWRRRCYTVTQKGRPVARDLHARESYGFNKMRSA